MRPPCRGCIYRTPYARGMPRNPGHAGRDCRLTYASAGRRNRGASCLDRFQSEGPGRFVVPPTDAIARSGGSATSRRGRVRGRAGAPFGHAAEQKAGQAARSARPQHEQGGARFLERFEQLGQRHARAHARPGPPAPFFIVRTAASAQPRPALSRARSSSAAASARRPRMEAGRSSIEGGRVGSDHGHDGHPSARRRDQAGDECGGTVRKRRAVDAEHDRTQARAARHAGLIGIRATGHGEHGHAGPTSGSEGGPGDEQAHTSVAEAHADGGGSEASHSCPCTLARPSPRGALTERLACSSPSRSSAA